MPQGSYPHPYCRPPRRKKTTRRSRYTPTLVLFMVFGLPCLILGFLIGRLSAPGKPEPSPEKPEPTKEQVVTTAVTTAAPVITSTEAPPETADPQDLIDDATTRTVYLTFDDGPGKYTFDVLDILDQYGVKATFFTVGCFVDQKPENAKAIVDRGHLIGCHSYTHDFEICYASVDAFMGEVDRWEEAVRNATGSVPKRLVVRFPGRSTTGYAKDVAEGIKNAIIMRGGRWFDWNAANNDKYPNGNIHDLPQKEYFIESYKESMGWYANDPAATVIFLTHETEKNTVETLPYMLQDLMDRGYQFKTLDHHPDWND